MVGGRIDVGAAAGLGRETGGLAVEAIEATGEATGIAAGSLAVLCRATAGAEFGTLWERWLYPNIMTTKHKMINVIFFTFFIRSYYFSLVLCIL